MPEDNPSTDKQWHLGKLRELAKEFFGFSIIGGGGFCLCAKIAKVYLAAFEFNFGSESSALVAKNTLNGRGAISPDLLIGRILCAVAHPNIAPSIIERVHIFMVNVLTRLCGEQQAVHPQSAMDAIPYRKGYRAYRSVLTPRHIPIAPLNERNVSSVDDSRVATRKWDDSSISINGNGSRGVFCHV